MEISLVTEVWTKADIMEDMTMGTTKELAHPLRAMGSNRSTTVLRKGEEAHLRCVVEEADLRDRLVQALQMEYGEALEDS